MLRETFTSRHIGPAQAEKDAMLKTIGVDSLDALIDKTIPSSIRLEKIPNLESPLSEYEYINNLRKIAGKNKQYKSFIGQGYYGTIIPPVVQRNVLENPGWYTAYTPYQAEIAQGRLEALLNFQTMVIDLTGLEMANASLLDEATAAGEAALMLHAARKGAKKKANKLFIDQASFAQTIDVIKTRTENYGIEIELGDWKTFDFSDDYYAVFVQYPNSEGSVENYKEFGQKLNDANIPLIVAADLMSLALLEEPGSWGASVVLGNTQRFGVPMGFGGPHAAYFATKADYKRLLPGRIIGVSEDRLGKPALRMALQTREQHIRRDKATSNICTAQALLAIMASSYAVFHGPTGLKSIAKLIHAKAALVKSTLEELGFAFAHKHFFDTLWINDFEYDTNTFRALCDEAEINVWVNGSQIGIALDEAATPQDVKNLISVFEKISGKQATTNIGRHFDYPNSDFGGLARTSEYLTHPIFNKHHSETDMMRYLKALENKDISLVHAMIPLGSCTMKLNAATELAPITWPEFAHMHPFTPNGQIAGYKQLFSELEQDLAEITGFSAVSLQPNSGAQGEYAGLLAIKAYHADRGEANRNIMLIPSSAHGTNPASAVMAGLKVVVTACDDKGNIDLVDLKEKAELHKDNLSGLMVTYPSTHGVFEADILDITKTIHDNGGLVYMDGANMNAQVGLTNPGRINADVCHLNLHKTFAIPHGGGGPGMGPICVNDKLAPYLSKHVYHTVGGEKGTSAVSAAPWGSALILIISHAYIKMLGLDGLTESTRVAILNANYIKARLEKEFDILYTGVNGTVAHEMIVDLRPFKKSANIEAEDVAKRFIDFGFHAPTLSFPVAGTIMIEPTESESKHELDRFCEALLTIKEEMVEVIEGKQDALDNTLKNAPHTAEETICDWTHAYSREQAVYPMQSLRQNKFWPSVSRVNNAVGDRNLICACPSIEEYM